MAPDDKGAMQRWAIEWGGGGQIQRMGITRETLKPGDVVVITGAPSRQAADHRLLVRRIERPLDGWKWDGTFD
jgi:thiamine monophosphate kinase